jgi:endonuclease/exonuclease/phosphatase (EEP) superfamily protein YafD
MKRRRLILQVLPALPVLQPPAQLLLTQTEVVIALAPGRSRSAVARILVLVGFVAVLGTAGVMVLRPLNFSAGILAYLVSFTPYGLIALGFGLVCAALGRSLTLALLSVLLIALQVWWLVPFYTATSSSGSLGVVVMTANIKLGKGDPATIVTEARNSRADLLALQEVTPEAVSRLAAAGVGQVFRYAYIDPGPGFHGTALYSRTPLTDTGTWTGFALNQLQVRTTIDGHDFVVVVVHIAAPQPRLGGLWGHEMASLADRLHALRGSVVALGDFNTTYDVAAYRKIASGAYIDAADQAGAGFIRTFPVGGRVPPLFAVDHVVMRDATLVATNVDVIDVPGSDHRGLVVRYSVGQRVVAAGR